MKFPACKLPSESFNIYINSDVFTSGCVNQDFPERIPQFDETTWILSSP